MPKTSQPDRNKYDHSDHPTTHRLPDDLEVPGANARTQPRARVAGARAKVPRKTAKS